MRIKSWKLAAAKLEKFRSHMPEETTENATLPPRHNGRDVRISKTVRMRRRYSEMLRDESYRLSITSTGTRVSEADLIDEALDEWRKKHKIPAD